MQRTDLGDRRPYSGGHWLHVLDGDVVASLRVWWAETEATEEYEDALLSDVRGGRPPAEDWRPCPIDDVVLPFANLRRPTGERRASGLAGSLLAEVVEPAPPPKRVVVVPDGDAEGARGEPPERRRKSAGSGDRAPRAVAGGRVPQGRIGTGRRLDRRGSRRACARSSAS